jgi:hypothetical protein
MIINIINKWLFLILFTRLSKHIGNRKRELILIETKKGRNPLEIPSERDFSILDALKKGYSQAEVGRVYGLTRQCVHQIKNRWSKFC